MQVVTLRGSNLIEVTDGEGVKSLALFPAKFQTSFWIKNGHECAGNFVVVDASGRDEALESGSRKPAIFKSTPNGWATGQEGTTSQAEEEHNSKEEDDDDDMPPLEANTNRNRPFAVHSDTESDSDS
ncbi:hypothetical protein VPH35_075364 [Triticum aestivum]